MYLQENNDFQHGVHPTQHTSTTTTTTPAEYDTHDGTCRRWKGTVLSKAPFLNWGRLIIKSSELRRVRRFNQDVFVGGALNSQRSFKAQKASPSAGTQSQKRPSNRSSDYALGRRSSSATARGPIKKNPSALNGEYRQF